MCIYHFVSVITFNFGPPIGAINGGAGPILDTATPTTTRTDELQSPCITRSDGMSSRLQPLGMRVRLLWELLE